MTLKTILIKISLDTLNKSRDFLETCIKVVSKTLKRNPLTLPYCCNFYSFSTFVSYAHERHLTGTGNCTCLHQLGILRFCLRVETSFTRNKYKSLKIEVLNISSSIIFFTLKRFRVTKRTYSM